MPASATLPLPIAFAHPTPPLAEPDGSGTGRSLPGYLLTIATISSISATLLSLIAIYSHLKRYLKPHLQRHVVRLLLIVPIYATSSLIGLFSLPAAFLIDLIRDLYEAFAIYSFFELLVAYLGGERSTLILMIGRQPVPHPWPFRILFRDLDLSDPYTFLNIKRGVLQYVQIKPILAISTVILKSLGRYEEGELAAGNGYTYISAVYNVSIFLSLYALALFWSALSQELAPFRPTSKFLTVKGVVFATFWQGWAISVLVAAGLVKTIGPISDPSFLRLGLQDLLLTLEMPLFALGHMYAFSSKDYLDSWATHQARLPILYALRDALGGRDVLQDFKKTMRGTGYGYAKFEPARGAVHQGLARSRRLQAGLRYTQGGKGKYFLPGLQAEHGLPPDPANDGQRTRGPIAAVKKWVEARKMAQEGYAPITDEEAARVVSINPDSESEDETHGKSDTRRAREGKARRLALGLEANLFFFADHHGSEDEEDGEVGAVPTTASADQEYALPFSSPSRNESEENLYTKAKNLEHGDYAFPTIALNKDVTGGEEEWLLGRGGEHHHSYDGQQTAAVRSRRKRVEGWMDRVSSRLLGARSEDERDDDSDDGDEEREQKRRRGVWGTWGSEGDLAQREERGSGSGSGTSRQEEGQGLGEEATSESQSAQGEPQPTDSTSQSAQRKPESAEPISGPRSKSSANVKAKAKSGSKSKSKSKANSTSKGNPQATSPPAPSEPSSESSHSTSPSHGAVDLIITDSKAERRNRDMERRRGDPAVRTDGNARRVFRNIWQAKEEVVTTPGAPQENSDAEGKTAVVVNLPQDVRHADEERNGTDGGGDDDDSQRQEQKPSSSSSTSSPSPSPQQPHMQVYHRHDEWKWGGVDDTSGTGRGTESGNPWA